VAKAAISPTREQDYPEWYQQVIKAADLADNSPVRGCMVIKPWGYGIWELMQKDLDRRFKETGHENAYFPLLIPLRFLEKEAQHVEGFAKECAVVTHHRLRAQDGKLIPDGKLDEPYIIRPTSETIIGEMYANWVQSYRDLPILINQWANVMRWEMRTRIFLRTSEFLWQEGHTVHETQAEAEEETKKMLGVYETFAKDVLAIPVFSGEKTSDERFPGAVNTYSIEAMMQDGKALQAGTSHFLGQNFSKASEIKFQDRDGNEQYAWTTSWGVSTRLVGALIMSHSDDNGLVLPPAVAPKQIVIVPIYRDESRDQVLAAVEKLKVELEKKNFRGESLRVRIDDRDLRGGEKNWEHIKKGVPLKVEIGPKDLEKGHVCVVRRDDAELKKCFISQEAFVSGVESELEDIQHSLYERALKFRDENTRDVSSLEELKAFFKREVGFVRVFWCEEAIGHAVCDEFKITPRCIIGGGQGKKCVFTGQPATAQVLFARSY